MKNTLILTTRIATFFVVLFLLSSCSSTQPELKVNADSTPIFENTYWHVKAVHPNGYFLDIKAFDNKGTSYEIKAIQDSEQKIVMNIKAFVGDKVFPVKILDTDKKYDPVSVIADDGSIYNLKAITPNGDKLDIKGVSRSGNIIHVKAISKEGDVYGVIGISPNGNLVDVKGIKMTKEILEYSINGVAVHAHVKTLPQTGCVGDNFIWHIKAIHPAGHLLDIKAIDKEGKVHDVKAIRDSNQRSLLDIKAFVGETDQLSIKVLVSDDKYAPVNAIAEDGTLYDIKAFTADGKKLDVKGVKRCGNIIHIVAICQDGSFFGIKAISPKGEMNDVKGVKMFNKELEGTLHGVKIYAHIKALPQGK